MTLLVRSASLIGNEARAAMLLALDREEELASRDLASVAGVSTPTASSHLSALVEGGLVSADRRGRVVRYRLASPAVARALRALADIAPEGPTPQRADPPDRVARTCYRHLGGRLGVGLTDAMQQRRWIVRGRRGFDITIPGRDELAAIGVYLRRPSRYNRPTAVPCMDRTERRPHLGGLLGIRLAQGLFDLGWIEPVPGTRAVTVTPRGTKGLRRTFGLQLPDVERGAVAR